MSAAVVADTHAIVWYLSDPDQLSAAALIALEQAEQAGDAIYISAITMVELCYLVEKGRLPQSNLLSLDSLLDDAESVLTLVPLDSGVSRALRQVPRDDVPDMPDRIIAATGLYLNVPVVTRDPHIQAATITSIW